MTWSHQKWFFLTRLRLSMPRFMKMILLLCALACFVFISRGFWAPRSQVIQGLTQVNNIPMDGLRLEPSPDKGIQPSALKRGGIDTGPSLRYGSGLKQGSIDYVDVRAPPSPGIHPRGLILENKQRGDLSQSVTSTLNNSACVMPVLKIDAKEITKFHKKFPRTKCPGGEDWVTVRDSRFVIKKTAEQDGSEVRCDAYPIAEVSDFKVKELDAIKDIKNGTRLSHDFLRVMCSAAGENLTYENFHAGIRHIDDAQEVEQKQITAVGLDIDVIMIGIDSTSRLAWHRHLPLTRDYFVRTLSGVEMEVCDTVVVAM